MVDDLPITLMDADMAREAIERAPYLAPIIRAVLEHDIGLVQIQQNAGSFNIQTGGRPWILWIHDDPAGHATLGPDGFDIGWRG